MIRKYCFLSKQSNVKEEVEFCNTNVQGNNVLYCINPTSNCSTRLLRINIFLVSSTVLCGPIEISVKQLFQKNRFTDTIIQFYLSIKLNRQQ